MKYLQFGVDYIVTCVTLTLVVLALTSACIAPLVWTLWVLGW